MSHMPAAPMECSETERKRAEEEGKGKKHRHDTACLALVSNDAEPCTTQRSVLACHTLLHSGDSYNFCSLSPTGIHVQQ